MRVIEYTIKEKGTRSKNSKSPPVTNKSTITMKITIKITMIFLTRNIHSYEPIFHPSLENDHRQLFSIENS